MPRLFTRSNIFSAAALLIFLAAFGYFLFYVPRSEGVTTIIFGTGKDTVTVTWNDVRHACGGTRSGTTVEISPTLHVTCVR